MLEMLESLEQKNMDSQWFVKKSMNSQQSRKYVRATSGGYNLVAQLAEGDTK